MMAALERKRRSRERQQLHRGAVAAALGATLPVQVLAGELARSFSPSQLDRYMWHLVEAANVTCPGHSRTPLDAYFTPPPVALAVTQRVAELVPVPARILEPSAGLGAFVQAASSTWSTSAITAVDIRVRARLRHLEPRARVVDRDFLLYPGRGYDLILGNPPFIDAERHIEHALELLRVGGHLAFILRAGYVGSVDRALGLWARAWPRYWAPIVPRPSFLAKGNDQSEYALYVWQRGWEGKSELGKAILWRDLEPRALRGAA